MVNFFSRFEAEGRCCSRIDREQLSTRRDAEDYLRRKLEDFAVLLLGTLKGIPRGLPFSDVFKKSLKVKGFSARPADLARRYNAPKESPVLTPELTRTADCLSMLFQDSDKGGALCGVEPYLAAPIVEDGNCLPRRVVPKQRCPGRVDGNCLALYRGAKDGLRCKLEEFAILLLLP